uniref:Uncharacterized protein n=1 Tax=Anguilla anguilla TaxID=7936 RepID=A0A0E9TFK9_ANGAN
MLVRKCDCNNSLCNKLASNPVH